MIEIYIFLRLFEIYKHLLSGRRWDIVDKLLACKELVEGASCGPYIDFRAIVFDSHLLGCHVLGRARRRHNVLIGFSRQSETKVDHFESVIFCEHDIAGF